MAVKKEYGIPVSGSRTLAVGYFNAQKTILLQESKFYGNSRIELNLEELKALHEVLGKVVHEAENGEQFRKTSFEIEGFVEDVEGYTMDDTWNGWQCPYFTLESAMKVFNAHCECEEANEGKLQSYYDEKSDSFYIWEQGAEDTWTEFPVTGKYITVLGEQVKVYEMGQGWVWDEVEEYEPTEEEFDEEVQEALENGGVAYGREK